MPKAFDTKEKLPSGTRTTDARPRATVLFGNRRISLCHGRGTNAERRKRKFTSQRIPVKTFNATEQNYPIYDRELFALIRALKEWKVLLEGAPHEITVYTDHQNLKYFRSAQDLSRRQFRWSMYLSQFPDST
jgi:hypothetical protein